MSRQSMHCFGGKKCMKFDIEVWRVENKNNKQPCEKGEILSS